MRARRTGLLALTAIALTACVPHPVGPARTARSFERTAGSTVAGAAVRSGIRGPWLIVRLLRRLEQRSHVIPWSAVASAQDGRVALHWRVPEEPLA